jgi:phosphoribosyl 1,2-cyclic phosphodiesterase
MGLATKMKLKIINSGSAGNCYILESETSALVIECGVRFTDIKQALDFNLRKVTGVLISHEHQDHCKSVKDVIAAGLNVYASYGTIKAMGIEHTNRVRGLMPMDKLYIGEFSILGFDVKHDAAEPFGFLISHSACGNVLFVTDTYYVSNTFKNLNQVIVEANYCPQIVNQRMETQSIHGKVRDRVIESHMSIDTCLGLLKANDLSAVNNIVLIHLSDGNSNAAEFKQKVSDATGKTVHIAGKNMEIDLSKTPF